MCLQTTNCHWGRKGCSYGGVLLYLDQEVKWRSPSFNLTLTSAAMISPETTGNTQTHVAFSLTWIKLGKQVTCWRLPSKHEPHKSHKNTKSGRKRNLQAECLNWWFVVENRSCFFSAERNRSESESYSSAGRETVLRSIFSLSLRPDLIWSQTLCEHLAHFKLAAYELL